jgi:pentatricopeptide repeat protein
MLTGYAANGRLPLALSFFRSIPRPDTFSYNTLLHALAVSSSLADVRGLFEEMPVKDSVSYNVMISSHANHGLVSLARHYFDLAPEKGMACFLHMCEMDEFKKQGGCLI